MKYENIVEAIFVNRPNRLIANVLVDGELEKVHVKNTGRCKEILSEGTKVYLEKSNNPNRKTRYSLISAYKDELLINIDSQVPNQVVYSSIHANQIEELKDVRLLKKEVTYGDSRFDLYYEKGKEKGFIEVKGVTLEIDGLSLFPDAPTDRGTKHINGIIESIKEGYKSYIFFLIQIPGIKYFKPNEEMDKKFAHALLEAKNAGVQILAYNSLVTKDQILLDEKVEVLI
ncbi:Sugar fermentation stimulation protein homolog [[Clostridium] ultunense Esp]|uniref:Sugar fermentation stimulation protein homolog n=1 Tax=[Clostridium] ultunense Esp TaxID=1288971 RepID=M1Z899_9FIRM|nr:DNA/RNA nuclease SfsA [Schnuerera ultunensis]CCQ94226.1 Sugar fermentation stimulation protein homolog [[Clostridium] ultunense Esp]SHD76870.1 Sugar fermentation stimulation protein homolog [[Clostridium] ultunense Esp]